MTSTSFPHRRRILVIDDNESIHNDFKKILSCENNDRSEQVDDMAAVFLGQENGETTRPRFEVDSAHQGREGLDLIKRAIQDGDPYMVAFVDMRMPPGWDGFETIQAIWKEHPRLQVVICTAYSDRSWDEIAHNLEYPDQLLILMKPFEPVEVRQIANALSEKWKLAREADQKLRELEDIMRNQGKEMETAQKELAGIEKKLQLSSESAEIANRSKAEFFSNMTNEIRNPMSAILGYAEMLREEGDLHKAPPYRIEAIDTILRNGNHLMQMINDMLELSSVETGDLQVERTACSPLKVISDVLAIMHIRAGEKELYLVHQFDTALPKSIKTDPCRLRQMLINLIGNAIKYTSEGGISIRISQTEDECGSTFLNFDVKDSGSGIPEAHVKEIFSPFTIREPKSIRLYGGNGLRMATCLQLAKIMGGGIELVDNTIGRGCTFRLTIEADADTSSSEKNEMLVEV